MALYFVTLIKEISKAAYNKFKAKPDITDTSLQTALIVKPIHTTSSDTLPDSPKNSTFRQQCTHWLKEKLKKFWHAINPFEVSKETEKEKANHQVALSKKTRAWQFLINSRFSNSFLALTLIWRVNFFLWNLVLSTIYAQADNPAFQVTILGALVNRGLNAIALVEASSAALLTLLFYMRMRHTTHLVEFGETVVHSTLGIDLFFGRNNIYIGWILGTILGLSQRFGPGTKKGETFSHTLPSADIYQVELASPLNQSALDKCKRYLVAGCSYTIRFLQWFNGIVNSFVPAYKTVAFLAQALEPIITKILSYLFAGLWGLTFSIANIGTQFARRNTNAAIVLAVLVSLNTGKSSLWQTMLSICTIWAAYNLTAFPFGNNLNTWLIFAFSLIPSLMASFSAFDSTLHKISHNDLMRHQAHLLTVRPGIYHNHTSATSAADADAEDTAPDIELGSLSLLPTPN